MKSKYDFFKGGIGLGMLLTTGLIGFVQDWFGLEGYIQHCRNAWINLHWSIMGSVFVVAIICIYSVRYCLKRETEEARDRSKKYHHAFSIYFPVYSDSKVGEVTDKELKNAMARYFIQLGNSPEGSTKEACMDICDTYEQEVK